MRHILLSHINSFSFLFSFFLFTKIKRHNWKLLFNHSSFQIKHQPILQTLLIESSSRGLNEDLDHTLDVSLKLLENLIAVLNMYRAKYLNSDKTTFKKLKVLGIQSVKRYITLLSVSIIDNGTYLYQAHRTNAIPTEMKQRYCLVSLFELLAFLLAIQLVDVVNINISHYIILLFFYTGYLL
jgi:hypothetical protein